MFAATHDGVRSARPMPRPANTRSFGERAFRQAVKILACILLGTFALATLIAVRVYLFASSNPSQPLYRLFSQLWS